MTQVYYVAFIVDRDLRVNTTVVVEAGVDLLAGPFLDAETAEQAVRLACRRHPRLAAFAGLASLMMGAQADPPVRMAVIPVSPAHVAAYNARHDTEVAWPPPLLPVPSPHGRPALPSLRKDHAHAHRS